MRALPSLVALMLFCTPAAAQEAIAIIQGVTGGIVPGQTPPRDNAQPAKPGTATLRGRVFAGDTGQPLRKAQVRINSTGPTAGQPPENRLAITDANGRYEFKELRAGRFNVQAQKGSYIPLQWGQLRPNEPGKPLDILDGQTVEKIDFSLPRGGVITGRVLDEFGDPAADVQVAVMRSQNIGGTRRLMPAGRMVTTNDIGEFRLFAIPPGNYYVSATLRSNNFGVETDDRSGYAPTYYPGTADVASAQRLTIALGQTITDLSLPLLPIRTARVSGTALDSQGQPLRGMVMAQQADGAAMFNATPTQVRPDGSFVIIGLTPGTYTLQLMLQNGPGGNFSTSDAEYASAEVTIAGDDVTGIRLVPIKPSTIAGRIIIGSGDASALRPSALRIGAFPAPSLGPMLGPNAPPVAVKDDWTFEAKGRAGLMRMNLTGLQPPWNIKSIRQRGTDVTDTGVDVRPGEDVNDVEVELTNRITDVSGLVTNSRSEPVKDYWIVFFARDAAKRRPPSRYVRTGRANQDGRFQMKGLPPGDYLVMAFDSIDLNEVSDPEMLDRLESRATRFTLGEAETKTLDLKLSATP